MWDDLIWEFGFGRNYNEWGNYHKAKTLIYFRIRVLNLHCSKSSNLFSFKFETQLNKFKED